MFCYNVVVINLLEMVMGLYIRVVTEYEIAEEPEGFNFSEDKMDEMQLYRVRQPDWLINHLSGDMKNGVAYKELKHSENKYRDRYAGYVYFRDKLAMLAGFKRKDLPQPDYSDPEFMIKQHMHSTPYTQGMYDSKDLSLEIPFVALIHFSDCEGIIGNRLCKILDKSFTDYIDKAKKELSDDDLERYKDLAACFKDAASSGGFVVFG